MCKRGGGRGRESNQEFLHLGSMAIFWNWCAYQVYWLVYIKHAILYSDLKEDLVRQVLEEMKILFEQNQKEV